MITGLSASVAECVTFPIDATKTRLQLQGEEVGACLGAIMHVHQIDCLGASMHVLLTHHGGQLSAAAVRRAGEVSGERVMRHRGAVSMAMHILEKEGIQGAYRGLLPSIVRHCIYSSSRICLYEHFRNILSEGKCNCTVDAHRHMSDYACTCAESQNPHVLSRGARVQKGQETKRIS